MDDGERQQLVDAAWRVLGRSGFQGFKVQLVLREAGVSARAFYRHFADKDELMLSLLTDEMARAATYTQAAMARYDEPVDQVSEWLRSLLSAATDPRRVARTRLFSAQQLVLRRYPDKIAEAGIALLQPLIDALAKGGETGVFPWVEPKRDADLVNAVATGKMTAALVDGKALDLDQVVTETTNFVLRALGVPPPNP